jgi:hypothetical protein
MGDSTKVPRGRLDHIVCATGVSRTRFRHLAGISARGYKALDTGDPTGVSIGSLMKVAVALGVRPVDILPALNTIPESGLAKDHRIRRAVEKAAARHAWKKPRGTSANRGGYTRPPV